MVRICAAKNCNNTSNTTPRRSFFKFPKDLKWASSWLAVCKNEVFETKLDHICNTYSDFAICDAHFEVCMFSSPLKNRLVKKAVPTICAETESPSPSSESIHTMEQTITVKIEPIDDNNASPSFTAIKEEYSLDKSWLYQQMKHSPIEITHEENITSSNELFENLMYSPIQDNFNHAPFNEKHDSNSSSQHQPVNTDWRSGTVPCRICLVAIDPKKSAPLYDKCHPTKTIKQMIKFCVPHKMLKLSENEFICRKCLKSVRLFVKFIEDFLKVEEMLKEKEVMREIEFVDVSTFIFNNNENLGEVQTNPALTPEDTQLYVGNHSPATSRTVITRRTSNNHHLAETHVNITGSSIPREMKVFFCPVCTKVYRCPYKLEDHQRKIHGIDRAEGYDCHSCHLHFTKLGDMESHWLTHTVYCPHCQKRFPEDKIVEHSEYCKREGEEVYEKSKSTVEENLQDSTDYNNSHSKDNVDGYKKAQNKGKHLCHICGVFLRLASDLGAHLRLHAKPNSFVCDKCPKSFRKLKILKYHKMYTHDKSKSDCKYCGKIMWNYSLLSHYKLCHSNEKNYFCKVCGEHFVEINSYKSHLRKHISMGHIKRPSERKADSFKKTRRKIIEKRQSRAKCEICSLTFSCNRSRDQHKRMHDDPSHSNRCDICLKICESKEELMEHTARHTLLSCSYCEEQFTKRELLYHHVFKCHQNQ